jgi:hypothetical protein
MPELHTRNGYFIALAVMAVIAAGFLLWFWRRGLLGRPGDDPALQVKRKRREPVR